MKVAQLMATIPDALPPEYAAELAKLQSDAPPMGWAFVKRRMMAELGADWQTRFASFEHHPAAAASLGQVHRARVARRRGARLQAAVSGHAVGGRGRSEAARMAVRHPPPHGPGDRHHRDGQRDRRAHPRGARLRARGQARRALPRDARRRPRSAGAARLARAVDRAGCSPSTGSRATGCSSTRSDELAVRNRLATAMFKAWWQPFSRYGVIHGDPHLGNYTAFLEDGEPAGHQPARLRLHPHLPAEIRRRRGRPLSRPARTATATSSSTPTRPGASSACRAS